MQLLALLHEPPLEIVKEQVEGVAPLFGLLILLLIEAPLLLVVLEILLHEDLVLVLAILDGLVHFHSLEVELQDLGLLLLCDFVKVPELLDGEALLVAVLLIVLEPPHDGLERHLEEDVLVLPLLIYVVSLFLYVLREPYVLRRNISQLLPGIIVLHLDATQIILYLLLEFAGSSHLLLVLLKVVIYSLVLVDHLHKALVEFGLLLLPATFALHDLLHLIIVGLLVDEGLFLCRADQGRERLLMGCEFGFLLLDGSQRAIEDYGVRRWGGGLLENLCGGGLRCRHYYRLIINNEVNSYKAA